MTSMAILFNYQRISLSAHIRTLYKINRHQHNISIMHIQKLASNFTSTR